MRKNLPLGGEQQLETAANTSYAVEQKEKSARGGARSSKEIMKGHSMVHSALHMS